ncbi:hypothetical protein [Methylobacterium trifolii]|uniref:Lipoprotein n=1 Tax=Methylobacterium trifolii TaxID=1003092 RepID=A0ABQ4U2I4_9HYPH|nr:hypothetical protein [Methylobacterium trifolii]GJE61352.1 hypothetical protein MPOCJGCO_3474 [Methylobacterium trifolii]
MQRATPLALLLVATPVLAALAGSPARSEPAEAAPPQQAPPTFPLMRVVPKGEARTIAFYASLFPDCSSQGPVVIRVLDKPQHGKVTIAEGDSFTRYAPASPLAACNSRKVAGLKLVYEAEEGFEGLDSFRIFVINADGTGYESPVKVSVR